MAAGKQQELKSVISVYGKADGSLDALAKKISSFGQEISRVGTAFTLATAPVIAAVKQSTSLYTDYDDILRKIQAAGGYSEKQMQTIGAAARQAGADTRYMASDAAGAFLSLTQAGVSLTNSLETLPVLLNAAAAGDMQLTDAGDLLISNIYSLGKAFERNDVATYMDKVVTAADASNTTVQEMMEGVSKIGAAGRLFAGGDSELLAFLGLLADLNMKGSTGGINARNMIISLLAPTQKAAKLMDALEISEEELDETLEGIDLTDSAKAMKWLGLETVDANGKVRPMIDILTDLKSATDALADDEKANILYNMFGKRTYPAIAGLLELLGEYPNLIEKILAGEGATQEKADTLEGGIGGATRTLKSAFEELQLSLGEAASGKVIEWMDAARGFMLDAADWIKGLDNEKVSTFMDTFAAIAGTGAALTLTCSALKTFSGILAAISTPGGAIALGAVALTTLGIAIKNAQDAAAREDLENHFGTLEIDSEKVSEWVGTLASDYDKAAEKINGYADAVKTAGDNYETYVRNFSGGILEAYLTQTELNDADKKALGSYVDAMLAQIKTAAQQRELQLNEIIKITYDGTNAGDEEKAGAWSDAVNGLFGEMNDEAQAAGRELMQTYLDAVADDTVTEAEREAIARAQESLNRVMAEIQSYQSEVELNALYARAMDLSHESVTEALALLDEAQQKSDEQTRDNFFTLTGQAQTYKNRGMSIPQSVLDAYGIEQGDYTGWFEGIERDMREQMLDNRLEYSIGSARVGDYAFDTYLKNDGKTDLTGIDAIAQGIINGTLTLEEAFEQADGIIGEMNHKDAEATAEGIDTLMKEISASMPFEELLAQIQWQKEKTGTVSEELMELYKDYLITGLFDGTVMDSFIGGLMGKNSAFALTKQAGIADSQDVYMNGRRVGTEAELAVLAPEHGEAGEQARVFADGYQSALDNAQVELGVETPGYEDGYQAGADIVSGFNQGVTDNKPIDLHAYLAGGIRGSTVDRRTTTRAYADGGYADTPSIFGEAGGEWAIPQEKTENSRRLLRRAAAGSGFSPEEIYPEKNRTEKTAMSFTFAPTIYARDAQGVKETLEGERAQMMALMESWWNEKMRESERVSFA